MISLATISKLITSTRLELCSNSQSQSLKKDYLRRNFKINQIKSPIEYKEIKIGGAVGDRTPVQKPDPQRPLHT